jgi:multiple sugar transport system ATP-binding protein
VSFLALERLEKTWPDGTRAVRGVDLAIERGEFVVLLGPSGCGKTTTLRMIAGLEQPTGGRVVLDGRDVTALAPSQRDVGFVFQFYALYPHLSVADNIAFPLECAGLARHARRETVERVARDLGLTELLPRLPRQLSGGDQQRVALARAMVRRPALWLMDEPLGTLDASRRGEMCEFLRAQQLEHGVTTVYVTHDQEEALRLADRVALMSQGEIQQSGSPQALYDDPASLFVARFLGSPGMNVLEGEVVGADGATRFHARGGAAIELDRSVRSGRAVLGVRPEFVRVGAGGALRGKVALDAFLGACRYVHVDGAFGRVVARCDAARGPRPGEEVDVAFEPAGLRLFDARSQERIA